jgi:hypothetical protein
MHSLAVACVVLGFLAAYKSHTLKVGGWGEVVGEPHTQALQQAQAAGCLAARSLGCALTAAGALLLLLLRQVPPIPNFYSPHSFMGLAAMLLLAGQVWGCSCCCAGAAGACSVLCCHAVHQHVDRCPSCALRAPRLLAHCPQPPPQYGIGFAAYLWPTISLEQRQALGPLHRFWGLAVYGSGMTAAAVSRVWQP